MCAIIRLRMDAPVKISCIFEAIGMDSSIQEPDLMINWIAILRLSLPFRCVIIIMTTTSADHRSSNLLASLNVDVASLADLNWGGGKGPFPSGSGAASMAGWCFRSKRTLEPVSRSKTEASETLRSSRDDDTGGHKCGFRSTSGWKRAVRSPWRFTFFGKQNKRKRAVAS